ncbi:17222_t:CDS:1, partial [Cetraspora pellucida]
NERKSNTMYNMKNNTESNTKSNTKSIAKSNTKDNTSGNNYTISGSSASKQSGSSCIINGKKFIRILTFVVIVFEIMLVY